VAAAEELENAINWTMGGIPGLGLNPCTDPAGRPVSSGVYWSRLQAGSFVSNRKMVVLQ
jgi:hypothetical protein